MWTAPEHTLPAEGVWVIGVWPLVEFHTGGFHVDKVRRVGEYWLDDDDRRVSAPAAWVHHPRLG